MLGKLILKILFKASLPLVAVAGLLSYGLYLKGGDPMAMWSTVANRAIGSIRESGANTVQSAVQSAKTFTPEALGPNRGGVSSKGTVYTWVDANGITHYGSNPPAGISATPMNIRTNSPGGSHSTYSDSTTAMPRAGAAQPQFSLDDTEKLPGMAGVKLPVNIQPEDLGFTREELLNMIGQ